MRPVTRLFLIALLLLGAPLTFAGEYYRINDDNTIAEGTTASDAVSNWCSKISGTCGNQAFSHYYNGTTSEVWNVNRTGGGYSSTNVVATHFTGVQCPASLPYEHTDGACHAEEELTCVQGQQIYPLYYPQQGDEAGINYGGCEVQTTGVGVCNYSIQESKWVCAGTGVMTGSPAPEGSVDVTDRTPPPDETQSVNTDSGSTTYDVDPEVTNPDGSTSVTSTEQTTTTSGSGVEISNDDDNFYIKQSDGTVSTYIREKTIISHADGTKTEVENITQQTDTPTSTTTTVNKNSGNTTTTNVAGDTITKNTNITYNYDANGNLTSSTKTSDAPVKEGNPDEEGNCGAPNQPSCDISLSGEDQLGDPSGEFGDALGKLDKHIELIEGIPGTNIEGDLYTLNPVNFNEGQTCDPTAYSTEYHGATFSPFYKFCGFYDDDIRPMLAFFFYCLTVFGCYTIWVKTMRGSA